MLQTLKLNSKNRKTGKNESLVRLTYEHKFGKVFKKILNKKMFIFKKKFFFEANLSVVALNMEHYINVAEKAKQIFVVQC